MTADNKIIFYSNRLSPFANRAWLALELSGLSYEFREVDLANKSEEFLNVSSTGKIPAISVNGENFVESAVIVELIADLAGNIRSNDAVGNAKSLLWADRYGEHLLRTVFQNTLAGKGGSDEDKERTFFESLDKALPYLPTKEGQFKPVVGDILVAPFVGRIHLLIDRGILPTSINEKLSADKKYSAYVEYVAALRNLDAFKATFNNDKIFARLEQRLKASLAAAQ